MLKDGNEKRLTLRIYRAGPDGSALPATDDSCFDLVSVVAD